VQGNYQADGGYEAALKYFSMERPPTAILAANDMSAMGVMNAAHEHGIEIPRGLSVIGLDDIQMASFARIDLTTINLPKRDMGAAAATLLMQRIRRKRTVTAKQVSFPMKLVVRGSTGPVR
jgi:LacI family transcriptional regulator